MNPTKLHATHGARVVGRRRGGRSIALGDAIVAAFDAAARLSDDPGEVTEMAAHSVWRLLREAERLPSERLRRLAAQHDRN